MPNVLPQLDLDRENGTGRYYIYWNEGRRNKRVSTRQTDLAAATAFYTEWLKLDQAVSTETTAAALTISDLWDHYMDVQIRPKTTDAEDAATNSWKTLGVHFGDLTPTQITQDTINSYVKLRTTGKLGARKVKPQSARKELSSLIGCLNFCSLPKHGQNKFAPLTHLQHLKLPAAGEPRDRWLTEAECERLIDAARALNLGANTLSKLELFIWLALYTAARVQALLDLTWDRVDFETRVIHLDVPGRRKTKKTRASVPIAAVLMPVLRQAYEQRENDRVLFNGGKLWASLQLCVIKAGLAGSGYVAQTDSRKKPKATGVGPHVLRHTAATHMARRGVPLWKIAKILGNTLAMVEKVYAKHAPDDLRDAVDLIGPRTTLLKEVKAA